MKLYNRKSKRSVEKQIHFGIGKSVQTACGLTLFSRHVMVQLGSPFGGAMITDDMAKVTCKRCLKTQEIRIRKLVELETSCPGVLDRPVLCGEQWLLNHGLDIKRPEIDAQTLELSNGIRLKLGMKSQDRKEILRSVRGETRG